MKVSTRVVFVKMLEVGDIIVLSYDRNNDPLILWEITEIVKAERAVRIFCDHSQIWRKPDDMIERLTDDIPNVT